MPVTPVRGGKPRRPIHCSICGRLIGSWFLYQTTHYPHMARCTERCETLIEFSRVRVGVPRNWRNYPQDWRAPLLATALLEKSAEEVSHGR